MQSAAPQLWHLSFPYREWGVHHVVLMQLEV